MLVATGTHKAVQLRVPGEDLGGIQSALTFLADVKLGNPVDLAGKKVLVVGGGNVAIDAARSARRLGAASVDQVSLECCEEMPAHDFEVDEARAEGITLHDGWGIDHFEGDGAVQRAEIKVCTCVFDPDGRFAPEYDETQRDTIDCDVVIVAAGMMADTETFGLETNPNRTLIGRRGDAADRRAARLRRRRRRHRPDDDQQRRRPRPPRRLHDRPVPAGPGARRRRSSTRRWASWTRTTCSAARTSTTGASRSSPAPP